EDVHSGAKAARMRLIHLSLESLEVRIVRAAVQAQLDDIDAEVREPVDGSTALVGRASGRGAARRVKTRAVRASSPLIGGESDALGFVSRPRAEADHRRHTIARIHSQPAQEIVANGQRAVLLDLH